MEFRNKALLLGTPVGDRSCTSEPTKRSRGSIGAAADERSRPVGRLLICRDFRHHRINENAKFPTEIFYATALPE